ncbi:hypothetical protein ZOSMA_51G00340 [Zostera marina]|uniref:DUF1771 domain-containing protein n=1 Tax=Zostera marina TaxID=29655 RepID=A0A0K9NXS7_ZOSMR|nr:hypothetical protein ZOSMA_51G00340 [Zostera marina]
MYRIASYYSKMASIFFFRSEHFLASQHSSKAREKWKLVEEMNAVAAEKIFLHLNHNNDI